MSELVSNPAVQAADLLVPKPLISRPYVWPFAIIYPVFLQILHLTLTTSISEKFSSGTCVFDRYLLVEYVILVDASLEY